MKLWPVVSFLLAVGLMVLAVSGWAEHGKRKAAEVRADSALADYHRLAADSAQKVARERLKDAEADSLRRQIAKVEQDAKDSLSAVKRTLAALDVQAATTLPAAQTVRDSMVAYQDLYTKQREATGRLLAVAAHVADSLLGRKDQLLANREDELAEARKDRDRWKASAGRLAQSVDELKGGGKFLGFIPRPPKWVAATVGCAIGALVDQKDRARGCGLGGTALAVGVPTD